MKAKMKIMALSIWRNNQHGNGVKNNNNHQWHG
jgi:hypothetical protein